MSYKHPANSSGSRQVLQSSQTSHPPARLPQPNTETAFWALEAEGVTGLLDEQLRRSEAERARLEAILRSMDEALLVVNEAAEVVLTNDAYAEMFGSETRALPATDAVGKPLPPEELPEVRATGGSPFTMKFTLTDAEGARRWFQAHGEPIRNGSGAQGGAVAIRDITERSLYNLQNEFMARVSHELGSPLSAVILSLRMVLRRLPPSAGDALAKEVRSYVETAVWEAERMRVLVGDLVDVSRLQRGRLRLRLQPEDLVPLLRRSVSLAQLGTRTQTFILDLPDYPVQVSGDATRLEQVVVNLLGNAIRHAPHSDRIEVRLRTGGGAARLEVQDYGPGIPSAELPNLFGRFYGVERPGTEGQIGLGLGLFITKELVDAHGGCIGVESEEGQGTRFTVRLPLLGGSPSDLVCTIATVPEAD
ncbi:MAG: ATP-binding protein [Ktedonobacterales bacterium]